MSRFVGAVVAVVASVLLASPALAAGDLAIPLDTVIVSGVAAGEVVEVAVVSSGDIEGGSCRARAVRPSEGAAIAGNDLVVRSGAGAIDLADVERESGATTESSTAIELGPIVVIDLIMGPAEQYAGDVVVELDCGAASVVQGFASPTGENRRSRLPLAGGDIALVFGIGAAAVATGAVAVGAARRRAAQVRGER